MRQPLTLSRKAASRVLRDVFNYPVLIPDLGADVNALLIAGDITRYVEKLCQLCEGGSGPATALLGYFHLSGVISGTPDARIAKEICWSLGNAGDSYCQFVLAWACKKSGIVYEAMGWMRRSAEAGFSPAYLDMGRWVEAGIGVAEPDAKQAMRFMWKAHQMGHRAGLVAIARLLSEDKHIFRKLAGYLIWPFAFIRLLLFLRRQPFSEFAFGHSGARNVPLLRRDSNGSDSGNVLDGDSSSAKDC